MPMPMPMHMPMQVARLPAELREDAVYVAVAALYLGLASGATASLAAGHGMRLTQMHCTPD